MVAAVASGSWSNLRPKVLSFTLDNCLAMLYDSLCYALWIKQVLPLLSHRSNPCSFKNLQLPCATGRTLTSSLSLTSELFLSRRGRYPARREKQFRFS
jgi:hypothetical protein